MRDARDQPRADRGTRCGLADAGYIGMGLIADDLAAIRDTIGFAGLRKLIADDGLTHVEIELIERWWIPRGEAGDTYGARDLLFEAADALEPSFFKIGSELGARTAISVRVHRAVAGARRSGRGSRHQDRDRDHAVLRHLDRADGRRNDGGGRAFRGRIAGRRLARLPGGHLNGRARTP